MLIQALCMQHTVLEFNNCLCSSFVDSFPLWRQGGGGGGRTKSKQSWRQQWCTEDFACGTGCLFNSARMRKMWGKIPEHQTSGPLVCLWMSDRTVSAGPRNSWPVSLIRAIFVPRSKTWGLCSLCYSCRRVFLVHLNDFLPFLVEEALHLLSYFLSCIVQWKYLWFCPFSHTSGVCLILKWGAIELACKDFEFSSSFWCLTLSVL